MQRSLCCDERTANLTWSIIPETSHSYANVRSVDWLIVCLLACLLACLFACLLAWFYWFIDSLSMRRLISMQLHAWSPPRVTTLTVQICFLPQLLAHEELRLGWRCITYFEYGIPCNHTEGLNKLTLIWGMTSHPRKVGWWIHAS